MSCANYMNQEAIDRTLRQANERLQRIDKACGMENPPLTYSEGTCCCPECHDAGRPDILNDYFNRAAGGDARFHRVCYKKEGTEVKAW